MKQMFDILQHTPKAPELPGLLMQIFAYLKKTHKKQNTVPCFGLVLVTGSGNNSLSRERVQRGRNQSNRTCFVCEHRLS